MIKKEFECELAKLISITFNNWVRYIILSILFYSFGTSEGWMSTCDCLIVFECHSN